MCTMAHPSTRTPLYPSIRQDKTITLIGEICSRSRKDMHMYDLTVSQQFLMFAVNKQGKISSLNTRA